MIANNGGDYNFASRFSEYESIETTISLEKANLIKWVWVDTFFNFPINERNIDIFNNLSIKMFNIRRLTNRPYEIEKYTLLIKKHNIIFDAICCKNISIWKKIFEDLIIS